MSVLVVGLNHRSAPVSLLERMAVGVDELAKAVRELTRGSMVSEAVVVSTCNRIEAYVAAERFHAGVADVTEVLSRLSGVGLDDLGEHLYVHYEDRAVQHLFTVACGLDSMLVGETQILGQLRAAYGAAHDEATTGRVLHELFQSALRCGKRAHSETGIDGAGASLVSVGLDVGREAVGELSGHTSAVVGAGSMSALAGATLRRADVGDLVVVNRSAENGARLAASLDARAAPLGSLAEVLVDADVVVTCTGSNGLVVDADSVAAAMRRRGGRPLFLLDLALPRDIDQTVRDLPGVTLADLESLRSVLADARVEADVEAVRRIVAEEVATFLTRQRTAAVAPTVVALRSKAAEVVDVELLRLAGRLPDLEPQTRAEVASTIRRVVDKLLHAPTVRVKELADTPGGDAYADALRELFGLDPAAADAVTRADVTVEEQPT